MVRFGGAGGGGFEGGALRFVWIVGGFVVMVLCCGVLDVDSIAGFVVYCELVIFYCLRG